MPSFPRAVLALLPAAACFPPLEEVDLDTHDTDLVDTDGAGAGDTDTDAATDTDTTRDTASPIVSAADLRAGDLELTEVHLLPAGCTRAEGQYVELRNRKGRTVDLSGLRLALGTGTFTISASAPLLVPTGEYVLGTTSSADCAYLEGLPVAFTFPPGDTLTTTATVSLRTPAGDVLDSLALRQLKLGADGGPTDPGRALQRHVDAWCMADKPFDAGDANFGTPGGPATGCYEP